MPIDPKAIIAEMGRYVDRLDDPYSSDPTTITRWKDVLSAELQAQAETIRSLREALEGRSVGVRVAGAQFKSVKPVAPGRLQNQAIR